MKKIVVLNGSPRAKGNTQELVKAFSQGATAAGHEVSVFNLQELNIHPCLGCCGGGKDAASPCVQKDDMLKIYPAYKEADIVVFASPLYYRQEHLTKNSGLSPRTVPEFFVWK